MYKNKFRIEQKTKIKDMPIISDYQKPHTIILDSAKYISAHSSKYKDEPIYNYYLSQIDIRIADMYNSLKKEVVNLSIEEAKNVFEELSGTETIDILNTLKTEESIKNDIEKIKQIDLILNVFDDIKAIAESDEVDEDSEDFQSFWNDLMAIETEKREYLTTEDVFA